MDSSLWLENLTPSYCPPWPCPICKKSSVALLNDSLVSEETANSKAAQDHPDWDPDWLEYAFTAWAKCTNPKCIQPFAISGMGGVGPDFGNTGQMEWETYYAPHSCYPMPKIIEIPKKTPKEVSKELDAAFSLFWAFPAACAGRIRVALELLLDHLGVPTSAKNKKGKSYDLTLHGRIDSFAESQPAFGNQLMALKWLGNTGSHSTVVSKSDLLVAFEILEHALSEIIGDRSARVAELAKNLTDKHS